jgi:CheY-like chemotaxis protein
MNESEESLKTPEQEGKPLLLIVDDHPAQRKLYRLLVENLDIAAHIVASCEEAIMAMQSCQYDLILMDWQMPEVDGLACTSLIREKEQGKAWRTPIVAVTAHVLPGDREACLKAGMDDYLGKPFTVKEFRGMIARWSEARHVKPLKEGTGRVG